MPDAQSEVERWRDAALAFSVGEQLSLPFDRGQFVLDEIKARSALSLRNNLIEMLNQRVETVRSAARFVFRNHPEIVREVTSAYQRRKRAEARRVAKKKQQAKEPYPKTNNPRMPTEIKNTPQAPSHYGGCLWTYREPG